MQEAGLFEHLRLRDHRPALKILALSMLTSRDRVVVGDFQHAGRRLKDAGLQPHEVDVCQGDAFILSLFAGMAV